MDLKRIKTTLEQFLTKYKYVALVLLVGIFLMLLPQGGEETDMPSRETAAAIQQTPEEQLEQILSQVEGVGKVRVMLTESEGAKTLYQTDEDLSADGSIREQTVIITDGNRADQGLVRFTIPPAYLGAIIVCQGADSPAVRLAVTEAVTNVTGITSDRITVLKMK